jgi:hypothetical protein
MKSVKSSPDKDQIAFLTSLNESIYLVCGESNLNFAGYSGRVKETIIDITSIQKNGKIDGIPIQTTIDSKIDLLVNEVNNKIEDIK